MTPPETSPPPGRVPTLTEVVDPDRWQAAEPLDENGDHLAPAAADARPPLPTEEQLARTILSELQRQIDVMLEYRVREVLGPLLARAADSLVRDARNELASTLRDVVARAIENELARHRGADR